MTDLFRCSRCAVAVEVTNTLACGYALNEKNEKICYECCADLDKEAMLREGRYTLYLVKKDGGYKVSNWPGSLNFNLLRIKKGKHNIAGSRYDCWFLFKGNTWHGVQYGEDTQICHVRRLKRK